MASKRLEKIKGDNMTVGKDYPEYIEREIIVKREAINPIVFNDIKERLTLLHFKHKIRSPPSLYKDCENERYYIQYKYCLSEFRDFVFDITDDYNWHLIEKHNCFSDEYILKYNPHYKNIEETKRYYPGSKEYDEKYPPLKKT